MNFFLNLRDKKYFVDSIKEVILYPEDIRK